MSRWVEVSDREFSGDGATAFLRQDRHHEPNSRMPVANLKTLSAIAIITAAVATPVFAQPAHHSRALDRYRGAYNQATPSSDATPRTGGRNLEDFEFNHSFPGGEDPSNNPPGN